jgi:hypothetical protein
MLSVNLISKLVRRVACSSNPGIPRQKKKKGGEKRLRQEEPPPAQKNKDKEHLSFFAHDDLTRPQCLYISEMECLSTPCLQQSNAHEGLKSGLK